MRSNSAPQVATSWHEPALPAFSALCDEAQRRCSTEHGLPVTPSDEMRVHAWQLCWLALDAASAPANNLPNTADAQALPVALIEQLRAAPALPKLNAQTWQELRRARDQQLFAALLPQKPAAAESITNKALATMLTDAFARVGLEQLRGWVTPSVTAAMTRWLSAGLLAIDSLALSDDVTDLGALDLVVFVQGTLHRVHGSAATADDIAQSELQQSDHPVQEAKRGNEPAAALAPQPAASPALEAAAHPRVPEPAAAIEQRPITSAGDRTPQPRTRPGGLSPRAIALGAGVIAVAATLVLMLKSSKPDVTQKADAAMPPVTAPTPAPRIAPPEPPVVEPVPEAPIKKPIKAAQSSKPPRFRNVAAAKRAHAAKKIDDAAYAAAIAELEAQRTAKIAKEQADLRSGKLSQRDYQRRVDAIDKKLGFNSP